MLHISDIHLLPTHLRKQEWLRELADLEPDLVINTGDNISSRDSVVPLFRSLGQLLDVPGAFVFGSNDYYSPKFKNPAKYLTGGTGLTSGGAWERKADFPFERLRQEFTDRGWLDLNNAAGALTVNGTRIAFRGVDDPHILRDELDDEQFDADADLRVGVTHAPYLRVLDHWSRQNADVVFAGHTHGGQLCVPGFGALVTNCDLEPARASGLHRHSAPDGKRMWMHVSAGCGTSPFTPVRFACRPEATLVTLTE